jgi:hypothetical protein
MINIQFSITNPWADQNAFDNLFCKSALISKHKAVEFEICKEPDQLLAFSLQITACKDHAGASMDVGIFGFTAKAQLYDTRHWDDENQKWEVYD